MFPRFGRRHSLKNRKGREVAQFCKDRARGAMGRVFLYMGLYFLFICRLRNAVFFKLFLFQIKEQRLKAAIPAPIQFCFIPLLSEKSDQVCFYSKCLQKTIPCTEVAELPSEISQWQEELIFPYTSLVFPTLIFPSPKKKI